RHIATAFSSEARPRTRSPGEGRFSVKGLGQHKKSEPGQPARDPVSYGSGGRVRIAGLAARAAKRAVPRAALFDFRSDRRNRSVGLFRGGLVGDGRVVAALSLAALSLAALSPLAAGLGLTLTPCSRSSAIF